MEIRPVPPLGRHVDLLSITVNSPVTVCREEIPVVPPQWERGKAYTLCRWLQGVKGLKWFTRVLQRMGFGEPVFDLKDRHGSKRPGVFIIPGENHGSGQENALQRDPMAPSLVNSLDVTIRARGFTAGETIRLRGKLKNFIFEGTAGSSFTGKGREIITVTVAAVNPPGHFRRRRGEMEWSWSFIHDNDASYPTIPAETRMELYWIYGPPGKMYTRGVWVEVLRLLATQCYFGLVHKEDVVQRIVNYCHSGTTIIYDVANFVNHYSEGFWGGSFKLKAFLEQKYRLGVCYDQAGLVQTLLGALGIPVTFVYTRPFGYLKLSNLFGRGLCNNISFLGSTPAPEIIDSYKPDDIEKWGGFGNHTFCLWKKNDNEEVVLDACVGPHVGNESKDEYLTNSIDRTAALYNQPYLTRPATLDDILECGGIVDVHGLSLTIGGCKKPGVETSNSLSSGKETERCPDDERISSFKNKIDYDRVEKETRSDPDTGVVCEWMNPLKCPGLKDGWKITQETVRGGCESGVKEWALTRNEEHLIIEIYVSSNKEKKNVLDRLVCFAASNTLPEIPFKKKPEHEGVGHLHIFFHSVEFCIFHNVCFRVESHNSDIDRTAIIHWLHAQAKKHLVQHFQDFRPKLRCDPAYLIETNTGEEVPIRVYPDVKKNNSPQAFLLDFYYDGDFIRLVEERVCPKPIGKGYYLLTFKCNVPGALNVFLFLVNRKNLLCSLNAPQNWEYFQINDKKNGSIPLSGNKT